MVFSQFDPGVSESLPAALVHETEDTACCKKIVLNSSHIRESVFGERYNSLLGDEEGGVLRLGGRELGEEVYDDLPFTCLADGEGQVLCLELSNALAANMLCGL